MLVAVATNIIGYTGDYIDQKIQTNHGHGPDPGGPGLQKYPYGENLPGVSSVQKPQSQPVDNYRLSPHPWYSQSQNLYLSLDLLPIPLGLHRNPQDACAGRYKHGMHRRRSRKSDHPLIAN